MTRFSTRAVSDVRVMGILNVTPDSFSDGGEFYTLESAFAQARRMVEEGAAIVDVGGESTRPGSQAVPVDEELARVIPVIERIRDEVEVVVSIDTSKPEVMRAAVAAGASYINDVSALRAPGSMQAVADLQVPVCLMHMQGEPSNMQRQPNYADVVSEVRDFLVQRARSCERAGILPGNIMIDPGFGFGKTLQHNLLLMSRLDVLVDSGFEVLVGVSRKSMLGRIVQRLDGDVVCAGVSLAMLAAMQGASILRVHDVRQTVDALKVVGAVQNVSACEDQRGVAR